MKKIIIAVVLIVVALFLIGTDLVVGPVTDWVVKNEKNSSAPKIQYSLAGYLYMVAQRQSRAVELYQTAFRLFPGYPDEPEAHYRVGLYYETKKDYPKATEQYNIILQKWPNLGEKLALSQRIARFQAYQGGSS